MHTNISWNTLRRGPESNCMASVVLPEPCDPTKSEQLYLLKLTSRAGNGRIFSDRTTSQAILTRFFRLGPEIDVNNILRDVLLFVATTISMIILGSLVLRTNDLSKQSTMTAWQDSLFTENKHGKINNHRMGGGEIDCTTKKELLATACCLSERRRSRSDLPPHSTVESAIRCPNPRPGGNSQQ
jgi:hypothetical protein